MALLSKKANETDEFLGKQRLWGIDSENEAS
jgi:hypothetical protein